MQKLLEMRGRNFWMSSCIFLFPLYSRNHENYCMKILELMHMLSGQGQRLRLCCSLYSSMLLGYVKNFLNKILDIIALPLANYF